MDILQVSPFSYEEASGVVEHIRNISEHLARRHNVTVYATDSRSKFPRCEFIDGVRLERFRRYAPSNAYFFSWELLLRLLDAEFDVVHAHYYHTFPPHFSALTRCKTFVFTPHFHGEGHSVFRDCLIRLLSPFGKKRSKRLIK